MYCIKCGKQIPDESSFCPLCGAAQHNGIPISTSKGRKPSFLAKIGYFTKKLLKGFGVFFFTIGIITYTWLAITEPTLRIPLIFMDALFLFFIYLLLRKKKPKKVEQQEKDMAASNFVIPTSEDIVSTTECLSKHIRIQTENLETPRYVLNSMRDTYTVSQAKNDCRILNDCLDIIEKTKNLDTFFSRYELGMRTALTLRQAGEAGIATATLELPDVFLKAAESQKKRVLMDSFNKEKEKIEKLATVNAREKHWQQYLEKLEQYEDQYILTDNEYLYKKIHECVTDYVHHEL